MATINLKRGYDLRLTGEAPATVSEAPYPKSVALHPIEFRGIADEHELGDALALLPAAAGRHRESSADEVNFRAVLGRFDEIDESFGAVEPGRQGNHLTLEARQRDG